MWLLLVSLAPEVEQLPKVGYADYNLTICCTPPLGYPDDESGISVGVDPRKWGPWSMSEWDVSIVEHQIGIYPHKIVNA